MLAQDHLAAGQLDEAAAVLSAEVRRKPRDAEMRSSLFQLYCVLGEWTKAREQVDVLARLSESEARMKPSYLGLIQCELDRIQVFSGQAKPTVLGKPDEWMGLLIHANEMLAKGDPSGAAAVRDQAFATAPPVNGTANGTAFQGLTDSDTRLGPMLEAFVGGGYRWVPVSRIKRITIGPPAELIDHVWVTAEFVWANGCPARGVIPARYLGSEHSSSAEIRLAQRTEWTELGGGFYAGQGQRLFYTRQEGIEFPLLDLRTLEIDSV